MAMSTSREDRPAPSSGWTAVIAWSTLALSAPLLAVAAWFAYDAATSSSEWASLGFLVTVAVAVPVLPAVALAVLALRAGEPRRARMFAVIAALLVASVPLLGAWLGLA
jgi:zinc transporter ZupT